METIINTADVMSKYNANHVVPVTGKQFDEITREVDPLRVNCRLDHTDEGPRTFTAGQRVAFYDPTGRIATTTLVAGRRFSGIPKEAIGTVGYVGFEHPQEPIIVPGRIGPNTVIAQEDTMQAILDGERTDVRAVDERFGKRKIVVYVGIDNDGKATGKSAILKVKKVTPAELNKHYGGVLDKLMDPLRGSVFGWTGIEKIIER